MIVMDQLADIALAIREKKNVNYSIPLANMANEIRSIPTLYVGDTEPENKSNVWVDTSDNSIAKYYAEGNWIPLTLVWG